MGLFKVLLCTIALLVQSTLAVQLKSKCGKTDITNRNIKNAMKGEFPYHVSVRKVYENEYCPDGCTVHLCSGVIISEEFVLTTVRCTAGSLEKIKFVYAGDLVNENILESKKGEQNLRVKKVILHPSYDSKHPRFSPNDIALLQLENPVKVTDSVRPIKLPAFNETEISGEIYTVTGWGLNNYDFKKLRYDCVTSNSNKQDCIGPLRHRLPMYFIPSDQICVTGENVCTTTMDVGNPLVKFDDNNEAVLIGIATEPTYEVIVSDRCVMMVFTRISNHLKWIKQYVKINEASTLRYNNIYLKIAGAAIVSQ
ncbi:granzyme F-like isoform X2 [Copidosoma floridanum]|uniref:granzyme F-like isoform X2 n=1 Tax=Copidosoma floridanum TaxID=29053 RepID=UPI0006C99236|nr:granzyme F-like isoform X2 [Copidosoma floridanum]